MIVKILKGEYGRAVKGTAFHIGGLTSCPRCNNYVEIYNEHIAGHILFRHKECDAVYELIKPMIADANTIRIEPVVVTKFTNVKKQIIDCNNAIKATNREVIQ